MVVVENDKMKDIIPKVSYEILKMFYDLMYGITYLNYKNYHIFEQQSSSKSIINSSITLYVTLEFRLFVNY